MYLQGHTGRGVRIAIVDSGVHASHPHVNGVAGGAGLAGDGTITADFTDRLGHGTAVAAAIREKAPGAEIVAIKVFWRSLATDVATIVRAFDVALDHGAQIINVSLGTSDLQHRARLQAAVAAVAARGAVLVAADEDNGVRWLPGALDGVIPVRADWTCDRDAYALDTIDGRTVVRTSAYPRDIPGVARERNVNGVSFAVANASAFVARAVEAGSGLNLPSIFAILASDTCVQA
jgi:subtilisin family serine protease